MFPRDLCSPGSYRLYVPRVLCLWHAMLHCWGGGGGGVEHILYNVVAYQYWNITISYITKGGG